MFLFRKRTKNKIWQKKKPKIYFGVSRRDNQEKRGRFSRFLFWVLFLGFLGVCVYLFLFSPLLDIDLVNVEGNKDISSEEIISKVNEVTGGKYFGYLSKRNFFLIRTKKISQKLKNDFNRLEVSSIERKFPKTILIRVKERQPEIAWCSGGVCYLIDREGFVYSGANATGEELNRGRFLVIVDDNARPIAIGTKTFSESFIQYLKEIDSLLVDDLGLQIGESYHTPGLSSQEVVARIKEGESWTLKLSSAISPKDTKKILETVFEKELAGDKRAQLDYLDLRVRGKVYFKLKVQN